MDALDFWLKENERNLISDIRMLVEIPSVANPEREGSKEPFGKECYRVLSKMLEIAMQDEMKAKNHGGYCASAVAGEGRVEIGIWNHLDVVPAGEGWTYPPFQCTEKNGFLIGRGVQDNKGPAIAVHYAMKYEREKKLLNKNRLRQILGCQEECGIRDVEWYLSHEKAPDYSFVADCSFPVCCGEKGISRITLVSENVLPELISFQAGTVSNSIPSYASAQVWENGKEVELSATGIGGHAAFPEGCRNALGLLGEKLLTLSLSEELKKIVLFLKAAGGDGYGEGLGISTSDAESGKLTCNVGTAQLAEGKLVLTFDIRYPVTKTAESFMPKFLEAAKQAGLKAAEITDSLPCYVGKENPFVQVLTDAYREITGKNEEAYVMGGGTYARKIPGAVSFGPAQPKDLTGLGLSPGHGGCHYADEAESMENLLNAVKIYVMTFVRLDEWIGKNEAK